MQMALGRRWFVVLSIVERPAHQERRVRQPIAIDAEKIADRHRLQRALRDESLDREMKFLGSAGWWYGLYGPNR